MTEVDRAESLKRRAVRRLLDKALAAKQAARKEKASKSVAEKFATLDRLRERAALLKRSVPRRAK